MKILFRYTFIPVMIVAIALMSTQCTKQNNRQKIKLDSTSLRPVRDTSVLTTTIQIEPEDRRSIVVFYFENVTGDEELEWMRRGLTQMLITDLSQSRYVDVVSEGDIAAIMEKMGIGNDQTVDANLAVSVAREARLETALVGSFVRSGEAIRIDAHLYDAQAGKLIKADRVEGGGLEEVFTLVDELTRQVRDGLRPTLKGVVEFDMDLADVTTNSIEAYRHMAEGLEQFESGLYLEAAESFEKAVAADTSFATAYRRLALAYQTLSRPDDVRRVLARAVALVDYITERERLNIMALDAYFKHDVLEMINTYEQIVERFPKDKETRCWLGRIYSRLNRFDDAIAQFEAALEIDNSYKLVLNQLGYSYWTQGRYDKAVEIFRRYLELAPDEPSPHDGLGDIYRGAGQFDEAIEEYKEAIRIKSDIHYAWCHLGCTYQSMGKQDEALRCFQHYIEVAPSNIIKSQGYRYVGEVYWMEGEHEKALEAFHTALKANSNDFYLVSQFGDLYAEKGDTAGVEKFLEEWFSTTGSRVMEESNFSNLINFIGTCLENDLHIDELEPFITRAAELAPNDISRKGCVAARAMVNLKRGRVDVALTQWMNALNFPLIESRLGIDADDIILLSRALADGSATTERILTFYKIIIDIAHKMNNPSIQATADYLLLEYYMRAGDEVSLDRTLAATGTPRESDWWIIGPFENRGGFHRRFPPEREIQIAQSYTGKAGKVQWARARDSNVDGYVDLKELMKPGTWGVTYGTLSFQCPSRRRAQLRIGTDDGVKLWLNGEEVWARNVRRGAMTDSDRVPVELKEGANTVLIKVCQTLSGWGFFFRITDPEGNPFWDLSFLPEQPS